MHKLILILLSCALIVGCAKHSAPDIEQYQVIQCEMIPPDQLLTHTE